jgi:hypothetical protein
MQNSSINKSGVLKLNLFLRFIIAAGMAVTDSIAVDA